MRCFYVRVHGKLDWRAEHVDDEEMFTPAGFYCDRYVFASSYQEAAEKAFHRVRKSLERQRGWVGQGLATLSLEAEELTPAPMYKLLRRGNRRQTFYQGIDAVPVGAE